MTSSRLFRGGDRGNSRVATFVLISVVLTSLSSWLPLPDGLIGSQANAQVAKAQINSLNVMSVVSRPGTTSEVGRPMATRAASTRSEKARAHLVGVVPSPSFLSSCTASWHSPACVLNEISAIDSARSAEQVSSTRINPAQFAKLTPAEQVFASTNIERVARGLQPVEAMTSQLNVVADLGAKRSVDPTLNGWTLNGGNAVLAWVSNWAGGLNALEADYFWMYYDGVGLNIDCPNAQAQGCWGHRANVLLPDPTVSACHGQQPVLVMGTAVAKHGYHGSTGIAEIIVESCGGLPAGHMVTWNSIRSRIA